MDSPDLRVPEVMAQLIRQIDEIDTSMLEGIFRRSPDAIEMTTFMENV